MSKESVQFVEMVRRYYVILQLTELERQEILLNIAESELNGGISKEQANELRVYYRSLPNE